MPKSFAFLILMLVLALSINVQAGTSIGISDYNKHALVDVGKITVIPVCKIMSFMNESVMLNCQWKQIKGSKSLPVIVPRTILEPNGRVEIRITVSALSNDYAGDYIGEVEIEAQAENVTGNPVVWGGSTTVYLTVKYMKPAEFLIYNLSMNETSMYEGDTIYASVSVINNGETVGNCTITFAIDGLAAESVIVTLEGNHSRTLDYLFRMNQSGSHILSVGTLSKEFLVNKKPENSDISWLPLIFVSSIVVAFGVGTVTYIVKRKNAKDVQTDAKAEP